MTPHIKGNETGTNPVITPVLTMPPGLPSCSQMYPDAPINAAAATDNIIVLRLVLLMFTRRGCSSEILGGEKAKLTRDQAEQLYDEAAGLVRAIMDLRDLEEGKIKMADFDEIALRDKLEDARRWVKYVKHMKE